MGMEIRQLSGTEAERRLQELVAQSRGSEELTASSHHASNKMFLCAALSFAVCVVLGVLSALIPISGIAFGLLLAALSTVAFITALVFAIIGLVQRFTKESVK